jgi:hypothetical protein
MKYFAKVEMGWSEGMEIFPSRIIEYLDGGKFSHCYWKFTMQNGLRFLYESHITGGVQITPYEHLEEAHIQGRVGAIEEVPVVCNPDALWLECMKYHGDPYDINQIIRYYIWIRFFHRHGQIWKPNTDGAFTCNEFCIVTGKAVVDAMQDLDYSYTPNKLRKFFSNKQSLPRISV